MPKRPSVPAIADRRMRKARAWILPVFVLSGFSGLVLEVVWVRLATLVLGITIHAVAVVVAAFMGGLAVGSWLFGRYGRPEETASEPVRGTRRRHCHSGPGSHLVLRRLPWWAAADRRQWTFWQSRRFWFLSLSFAVHPDGRHAPRSFPRAAGPERRQPLGGMALRRQHARRRTGGVSHRLCPHPFDGGTVTAFTAVAANSLAGLSSLRVARHYPTSRGGCCPASPACRAAPWPLYVAYAITGFAALGLQITWTRLFLMYMPGRAFVFSLILTTFLAGLAIGSAAAAGWAARSGRPATVLAGMQVLLAGTALAGVLWTHPVDRMLMTSRPAAPLLKLPGWAQPKP